MTSGYARTSVQTLGEGEKSPKATWQGVENAIFSWGEIARCFWATAFSLAGNRLSSVAFEKEGFFLKKLSLSSKAIQFNRIRV